MSYLKKATAKFMETVQSSPIPGSTQVMNNAGGFTWEVDDLVRLRRFICLGSEKGNYYTKEATLTIENAQAISRLIEAGRGKEVVNEILEYSTSGRTAKQDPIIFALAMCVRSKDLETKKLAYQFVENICRIPTFLFTFVEFVEAMDPITTGWGRGMRGAVSKWYLNKTPKELAFAVTKYKQRNGWSHKDLLRLCHLKSGDEGHQLVFKYITKGPEALETFENSKNQIEKEFDMCDHTAPSENELQETLEFLKVVEEVSKITDTERLCGLIRKFKLAREHLPTQQLNHVSVWEAMLTDMPMTAMIRNLAKMTSIGLLQNGNTHTQTLCEKLLNPTLLSKARVHPFNILLALNVYRKGHGEKGSLTWNPLNQVKDALNKAFYLSFKFVEPTGQRVLVGLDVSGSMSCNVFGSDSISCREAAMAMSLVMAKTEPLCQMMAFGHEFIPLTKVSPNKTLEENLDATSGLPFGGTDCSLPMTWALSKKLHIDTFIVYTDNETWAGKIHPSQALVKYRREMNIPKAKLIVVGMAVNEFSIADPNDAGMLDVAGFDSNAPEVMKNFMLGLI